MEFNEGIIIGAVKSFFQVLYVNQSNIHIIIILMFIDYVLSTTPSLEIESPIFGCSCHVEWHVETPHAISPFLSFAKIPKQRSMNMYT